MLHKPARDYLLFREKYSFRECAIIVISPFSSEPRSLISFSDFDLSETQHRRRASIIGARMLLGIRFVNPDYKMGFSLNPPNFSLVTCLYTNER